MDIGKAAEAAVSKLYAKYGYKILFTNYRYRKIGEIDLITQKNGQIIFTEVKFRNSKATYRPSEAVNIRKRNKIRTVGSIYILNELKKDPQDCNIRFDVAEVTERNNRFIINIIRDAF